MAALLALASIAVALMLVLFFGIAAIVAFQARKRGYSFFVWVLAGMNGNPLFFLVLLAIMPDFARRKQRK